MNPVVEQLLARSNRLGADPANTNYAGGNTSAKGTESTRSPASDVELLWVKGSGGDLGTLTAAGLAVLRARPPAGARRRLSRARTREDEMVAAFDFCLHGTGGAAPSIDTAMHGLVDAAHVDHLHPDSGIAIATAADGEQLTKDIYGDRVVWVPWRRPGFQLGLDIAADRATPTRRRSGVILGGHGITAWGATSDEAEANSRWIIETAQAYLDAHGERRAVRRRRSTRARRCEPAERRAKAAALAPHLRGRRLARPAGWSATSPTPTSSSTSSPARSCYALAALGTSCPDHFLRTKVKPLVLDLPATASDRRVRRPPGRAARAVPGRLPRLLRAPRHRRTRRRCAAPTRRSSSCPASACSPTAGTSRRPGSPASSTSTPST